MMMITPAITRNGMTTRRARDDRPKMRLLFGLLIRGSLLSSPRLLDGWGNSIYHHLSTLVDELGCPHVVDKGTDLLGAPDHRRRHGRRCVAGQSPQVTKFDERAQMPASGLTLIETAR
ncbi:hypothetical protein GCM10027062_31930 [Nocardioides hungaricus]